MTLVLFFQAFRDPVILISHLCPLTSPLHNTEHRDLTVPALSFLFRTQCGV